MLKFKAAIFDVDDTILDNKPYAPGLGLHEKSRLKICAITWRYKRAELEQLEFPLHYIINDFDEDRSIVGLT